MHIDNDKLVGTYVSDRYSEKGTVTIVLTDGDSTPTREYTRYKYVQTEQLTAIGVAVKDYGAVLVPETTLALFENETLNATDFGVFVKFNDEYYSISLSSLLGKDIGASVEFEENSFDDYHTVTFNATLPPYSIGNAGQVPTVDENGKVSWDDIPEELPDAPTTDGEYMLKVTVSGGVPTYGWVSGGSSSDVFIANYGTTTWATITAAYNQNKAIFCRVNKGSGDYRIAPLSFISIGAAEFNYYRSPGTINSTNPSDEMVVYRLSKTGNVWATETRPVRGIITAGTGIAVTYADNKPVVSAT